MEELKPLTPEELQNALNDFIEHFDADNFSEAALLSLKKTFQTHNITIQDWNTLVEYVSQNFFSYESLGQLMLKISDYVVLKPSSLFVSVESDDFVIPQEDK